MLSRPVTVTMTDFLDDANLPVRMISDQLGHVRVPMTQDRYFGRRVASTGAAHVLETVDDSRTRYESHG